MAGESNCIRSESAYVFPLGSWFSIGVVSFLSESLCFPLGLRFSFGFISFLWVYGFPLGLPLTFLWVYDILMIIPVYVYTYMEVKRCTLHNGPERS